MKLRVKPSQLAGSVPIPASKSHTVRALVIGSLAEGQSRLIAPLDSADIQSCIGAMRLLGAQVEADGCDLLVRGVAGSPRVPSSPIDVGNSGTTLYIACVTAALGGGTTTITGDAQIQARPIQPLTSALEDLGARAVSERDNGCPPVRITGPLRGGKTSIECPTSQYLTALLINCPLANSDSHIEVPLLHEQPYVHMTLDWLDRLGIEYEREGLERFHVPGGQSYPPFERPIPADFSSANFFMCAAAVTGSEITLTGLDMDDPQGDKAVVDMLRQMGAEVEVDELRMTVRGKPLHGCELDLNATPDALPALAATACFAEGETLLGNVPQARLKETDRISVMATELRKMGADITELDDGLLVRGRQLRGAQVDGHGDHRIVMALAVAGLGAADETTVSTAEAIAVTFPDFVELMRRLGATLEKVDTP